MQSHTALSGLFVRARKGPSFFQVCEMSCLRLRAESSENSVVHYMKGSLDKTNFNVCGAGSGKEQKNTPGRDTLSYDTTAFQRQKRGTAMNSCVVNKKIKNLLQQKLCLFYACLCPLDHF